MSPPHSLAEEIGSLAAETAPCDAETLAAALETAIAVLERESPSIRAPGSDGLPGGLVRMPDLPTLIVPDLHARTWLLHAVLASTMPGGGETIAGLLGRGGMNLLCLGDVPHAEGPEAARRWNAALQGSGGPMDHEMALTLASLRAVLRLKSAYPGNFHILKGNHDNMGNADTDGDLQFYKYAMEGAMGAAWFRARYGDALMARVRVYERALPLVACGNGFCASHAEPARAVCESDLRDYRRRPDLVRALIWTANGEADAGSVRDSLVSLLGARGARARWFAGHRPIQDEVGLRSGGYLVQLHRSEEGRACAVLPGKGDGIEVLLGRCGGPGQILQWRALRLDPPALAD